MLEEVAKLTPPHEATLRNLGTVYNQLRQHDKAKVYFDAAAELVGGRDEQGELVLDKEAAAFSGRFRGIGGRFAV